MESQQYIHYQNMIEYINRIRKINKEELKDRCPVCIYEEDDQKVFVKKEDNSGRKKM